MVWYDSSSQVVPNYFQSTIHEAAWEIKEDKKSDLSFRNGERTESGKNATYRRGPDTQTEEDLEIYKEMKWNVESRVEKI